MLGFMPYWRDDSVKISVVICTRDREETIGQAVESVANCEYPVFDIHIMDQSTRTGTRECVEKLAAKFRAKVAIIYHHLDKAGLSRASNAGARASDGQVIAYTDDDVIVPADWLSNVARAFAADSKAGLLYGQVLVPDELKPRLKDGVIVPSLTWEKSERLLKGSVRFKIWGMGANMAIARVLFEDVGGFDEALGGGGPLRSSQDYDFAYRTYLRGYAILLEPTVMVDHYGTRTAEQWPDTMVNYGIGDGAFYSKHIRCGDMRAFQLFCGAYALARAREIKHSLKIGKYHRGQYSLNMIVGFRKAMPFGIDRRFRLFVETEKGKIVVTQSNTVTATKRQL